MKANQDYITCNKLAWNKKVPVHLSSEFYDVNQFIKGKSTLNKIELDLLGNIEGKELLHLQCHFGLDTLSLARLGAKVTGVDFSGNAIEAARALANRTGIDATFICCDIYSLPEYLDHKFDIVFTSYGTVGWLPDLKKWAHIVSKYLATGGTFVIVDFHPVIWMYDNDFKKVTYRYFKDEPIIEEMKGSYTDRSADIQTRTITWNHSLSEIINSLITQGLSIEAFDEYDYSPYNCFKGLKKIEPGRFQIKKFGNKIPMVYSICSSKKNHDRRSSSRGA